MISFVYKQNPISSTDQLKVDHMIKLKFHYPPAHKCFSAHPFVFICKVLPSFIYVITAIMAENFMLQF